MALEAEEAVGQRVITLFLQQRDREELTLGLTHFAVAGVQVGHVEPLGAPGMAQIAFGLGNLVGVVGEGVVNAAAVEVKVFAVILHGDAGALNVPTGIAHAPRGVPLQGLVLELGLGEPEDEIVFVLFVGVLLHALTDADSQVLLIVVIEHIVALELAGVEVHVAAGKVGVAGVQQLGDDLDIVINKAGSGLHGVRPLDVQLAAVVKEGVGVVFGYLHDGLVLPVGALEHFILALVSVGGQMAYIRDVHDAVDAVAGVAQEFFQHILHDVAAEVADMGEVIHRGAAGVHFHVAGGVGGKFSLFVGSGVVEIHKYPSFQQFRTQDAKTPPVPLRHERRSKTAVPLSFFTQRPVTWAGRRASKIPRAPGRTFPCSAAGTLSAGDAPSLTLGCTVLFPFNTLFVPCRIAESGGTVKSLSHRPSRAVAKRK